MNDDLRRLLDDLVEHPERARRLIGWSMTPPPPVVHQRLLSLFADAHGRVARRRVVAHRVPEREALVVRADDADTHHVFTSDVADIAVSVSDGVISGHVLPIERPTPAAFAVSVIDGPTIVRSSEGDELGGFELPPVAPGTYRLLLDNTHLEIEVEVEVEGP